ncbi:LEAF RUST 10 DISEASE-RESISTANCE LOCUS RECEPTOR-LIKE PROTEIN KINASE-like 1.5 [Macadamia integrifolia]|uniref:LEAF RUST 10 DISEASE-RESISTANCE LOCUS RECEPTOR-LIKE PROTEIN KINASE-like 1.5 n=1 Tax=Macadamia integrifolia TaxID=60698 RepID=UPI001C4E7578|nr:LEAF RUST 10 DISEASE-RESISTANCE LOCUS RECEPTOR-LIKE PROTEIN KINASE-like 1.5 [Macadamia integrifolia]
MTHITEAVKKSTMPCELEKDKFSAQVLKNCKELMDYAIDDLKKSFDELGMFDMSKMDDFLENINIWIVVVKKLHRQQAMAAVASTKEFCNEILILSSRDHPTLVKLHGYYSDPRGLVLVYDYVPNDTLADHLHRSKCLERKKSLTWEVRVEVALQTAMALEYLHFSVVPAIVHRDITSLNIIVEKGYEDQSGGFWVIKEAGAHRLIVVEVRLDGAIGNAGILGPRVPQVVQVDGKE